MRSPAKLHRRTLFFLVATGVFACTEDPGAVQWRQGEQVPEERPISLRITPTLSVPPPALRFREETLGLLTAMVETGFSDLSDVTAHVGASPSPRYLDPSRLDVRLTLTLDGGQDTFVLIATLCQPDAECRDLRATGLRDDPFAPIAGLIAQLSVFLGRQVKRDAIEADLRASLSSNTYARLLTGRAGAVLYGVMPPPPPSSIGDKRKDPVVRAVFLDPDQALAQWIAGKRSVAIGELESAVTALETAQRLQPKRVVFAADLARALEGLDWRRAEAVYAQLVRSAPNTHRFTIARAHSLIELGRIDDAQQVLGSLPERYAKVPDILEMKVGILELRGETGTGLEDLLVAWSDAAPDQPEPVRRRIAWLVERNDFPRALSLTADLAERGATEESVRLRMSLALGARDYETARESAHTLGLTDVYTRIGARSLLERGKDPIGLVADAKDRSGRLVRGELLLREGEIAEALAEARALIRFQPYDSQALSLRVRALRKEPQLGDLADAEAALYFADPATAALLAIPRPVKKYVPRIESAPARTPSSTTAIPNPHAANEP